MMKREHTPEKRHSDMMFHHFSTVVPSYLVGADGTIEMHHLFLLFQETAWHHAEKLGLGFDTMYNQGFIWLLYRVNIHLNKPVRWGEKIHLETWPLEAKNIYAYRSFRMYDDHGNVLISATSSWILADRKKRTPVIVREKIAPSVNEQARGDSHVPDDFTLDLPEKITAPRVSPFCSRSFTALRSDIDVHGHVTNSCYVRWITDTVSSCEVPLSDISDFSINFLSEILCDNTASVQLHKTAPDTTNISVLHDTSGRPAARAKFTHKPD